MARALWSRIAIQALTAIKPFVRMSSEQSQAWDTVVNLLRVL